MSKEAVLVNIVSAQCVPNLIAAFDQRFDVRQVYLMRSTQMKERADWLAEVYRRHGLQVETRDIDAYDQDRIEEACRNVLKENRGRHLILNATGGTKVMSLVAVSVFKENPEAEIWYVDTDSSLLRRIDSSGKLDMQPCLSMEDYLRGYGLEIVGTGWKWRKGDGLPERQVPMVLFDLVKTDRESVETFHRAVDTVKRQKKQVGRVDLEGVCTNEARRRLQHACDVDGLDIVFDGDAIQFNDRHAVKYLHGGWFEDYVLHHAVRNGATEILAGVNVRDLRGQDSGTRGKGGQKVENELDCAILYNNRLFILEAKTVEFTSGVDRKDVEPGSMKAASNSELVYKLDFLKNRAGLFSKAGIVTLFPLTDALKKRAEADKLKVFGPDGLERLHEGLAAWIGTGTKPEP